MIDSSEGELGSETLASSDSCSTSCTRISFETFSPEQTSSTKPHHSGLNFRDFEIVRLIGRGDIGNVYLCRLKNSSKDDLFYAMKVVDKDALAFKNKIQRAETEKRILKMLNHPFLPTLYTHFEASQFSCVVMEFCSGGDLHSLRHKQPGKRFSLTTARFYAAEVLVALEYLHMLGIIYRDLKPENVLVRSDGHIMLSDFDLSLCSDSIPAVEALDHNICSSTTNKHLSCLFNSTQNRLSHHRFVAEPVSARSNSFVGTHEYVSPEVASGKSHGNAVDWWALGIFIYELVWGTTPFIGGTNKETLHNILNQSLTFPKITQNTTKMERSSRDLISRLLVKEPESRSGAQRGAADVKTHPFFKGINFALLRSYPPPLSPPLPSPIPAVTGCANRGGGLSTTSSVAFDYF